MCGIFLAVPVSAAGNRWQRDIGPPQQSRGWRQMVAPRCLWVRRKILTRRAAIWGKSPVPMSANLLKLGWDPAKWKLGGFSLESCEVVVEKIGVKRLEATFSWHIWMGSKHLKLSCSLRCMILETVPMRYFCPKIRCCPLALTSWVSTCTKPWIVLPTEVWLEKLLGRLPTFLLRKTSWIPSMSTNQAPMNLEIYVLFMCIWRPQPLCQLGMCTGSGRGDTWRPGNPPCHNCEFVVLNLPHRAARGASGCASGNMYRVKVQLRGWTCFSW